MLRAIVSGAWCIGLLANCSGGGSSGGRAASSASPNTSATLPSTEATDPVPTTAARRQVALSRAQARSGLYDIPVPAGLKMAESTADMRVFELPRPVDYATVRDWYDARVPANRPLGSLRPCVKLQHEGLIRQWQRPDGSFYVNVSVNAFSEPPTLVVLRGPGADPC